MNRFKYILVLTVVFVIAGILIFKIVQQAKAVPINDPDFIDIQTTLRTYADIKDQADYTFEDSRLSEVLANDPRGVPWILTYVESVRYMTGRPDLKPEEIGFLDVNQARYAFDRKVKQLFDQAVARGDLIIIPTPTDNAILPTPFDPLDRNVPPEMRATDQAHRTYVRPPGPESIPEIRALEQATGLGAALPVSPTVEKHKTEFTLLSVSIDGDVAYANVDWEYGLCEDILVRVNGRWYLAGHKIIKWHSG